jgi:hypothetical protein
MKLAPVVGGIGLAGCWPPSLAPGPTLPCWLVLVILGGFILYAYLRRGK